MEMMFFQTVTQIQTAAVNWLLQRRNKPGKFEQTGDVKHYWNLKQAA